MGPRDHVRAGQMAGSLCESSRSGQEHASPCPPASGGPSAPSQQEAWCSPTGARGPGPPAPGGPTGRLAFDCKKPMEREGERNINWLPPAHPLLGMEPTTQACALMGIELATS
uniref:Uncharacterized protein n=1 Tax=Pipistrellus kuhlii TaxID=59472 RepID=A0A7J7TXL0_PIPKU|nr:hypothetical protein mPipKuh1_009202 [Pipistrellus kuhlii]